jgi:hypothetical protein
MNIVQIKKGNKISDENVSMPLQETKANRILDANSEEQQ